MDLTARVQGARRHPDRVLLEGFHAVKHAVRFGAELLDLVVRDRKEALTLVEALAPDLLGALEEAQEVTDSRFRTLVPSPPSTGILAVARRKSWTLEDAMHRKQPEPTVLLEDPRNLGNVGAVIRNAAGLGAKGVVVVGEHDPWAPDAVRGAAGLQFAVPVVGVPQLDALAPGEGAPPILAVDPDGPPLRPGVLPSAAVLAFGSERTGLSPELKALAAGAVSIPMRDGVSSLNLATSVGIGLYAWTLQRL